MNIQEEINNVGKLEQIYLRNNYIASNQNPSKSIKAFNE